jgi:hypothetical protein
MDNLAIIIPSVGNDRVVELRQTLCSLDAASNGKFNSLITVIFNSAYDAELAEMTKDYKLNAIEFNGENRGFVYNLLRCLRYSRSKYVWIFGDDDIVHLPIYNQLSDALLTDVPLIHLPHFTLADTYIFKKLGTGNQDYILTNDPNPVIRKSGFISSNIYRRDIIDSFLQRYEFDERVINSYLPKFLTAYALDKFPTFILFRDKIIGQRIPAEDAGSIFINKRDEYVQHFHRKLLTGYDAMRFAGIVSVNRWITEHFEAMHLPVRLRVLKIITRKDLLRDYIRYSQFQTTRSMRTLLISMLPNVILRTLFRRDLETLKRKFPSLFHE